MGGTRSRSGSVASSLREEVAPTPESPSASSTRSTNNLVGVGVSPISIPSPGGGGKEGGGGGGGKEVASSSSTGTISWGRLGGTWSQVVGRKSDKGKGEGKEEKLGTSPASTKS